MGFLNKYLRRNFGASSKTNSEDRLDDDLRQLLKKLPNSTKRNLIQDLSNGEGGSSRVLSAQARGGLKDRRASEPQFAAIMEATSTAVAVEKEKSAKDFADSLMDVEDLPELKEIKELYRALKKADEDWVASFRDNGGVAGIYKAMAELAQSREDYLDNDGDDDNEHEVGGEMEV